MNRPMIDALEAALDAERSALVSNDPEALMSANDAKLVALRSLEASADDVPVPHELRVRLQQLMERNRANGMLLARRQREIRWALRHLGRNDGNNQYGADGRLGGQTYRRALGIG